MFSRKFSSSIRRKKRMIISSIILLVVCLGIGYSAFTTNLGISGTLNVSKYDQTLYGVLEKAAKKGTYATKYTGNHHDSFTEEPSKDIYYWRASGDANAPAIQDKNNVIFANHCWKTIRTTDTGGVKMIYNGEPENNQCLKTRGNHVGYDSSTIQSMSTTYYYGTSYTYDKTNNVFSLAGTVTTGAIQTGQYTCRSTSSTGTCSTLYLLNKVLSGTTYSVFPLKANSHYSQYGKLAFNGDHSAPNCVGYMYNTKYNHDSKDVFSESILAYTPLSLTYWYSNDVTWGTPTVNQYALSNPYQVSNTTDYPNLVGKYTLKNENQAYTNTNVYYIASVDNETMYYIQLGDSLNHSLSDYNYTYTFGDGYTDNENGTYTINNPTTINRSDWYTNYNNIGAGKYVCKNATNNTCSDLWYTTSTSNVRMEYIKVSNVYKYAKGFTYNNSTATYTLNDDSVSFWNISDNTNKTSINNAHYTCFNMTGECTNISYIYHISGADIYYVNLTGGIGIEEAVNEMLYNNDVNTNDSTIKTGIDAWYKRYMTSYTSMLEDIIFCNDRSQSNQSTNGWNPNGGNVNTYMNFSGSAGLSCLNDTDKFSVSNNKAKLTYPTALMTYREMNYLNNSYMRITGQYYWLASPYYFNDFNAQNRIVSTGGSIDKYHVSYVAGVRPAISLKPGTEYVSGTGSMADPYVVDVPMATLTINYKTTDGTVLHEPYVETMPVGADYSITSPTLIGYEPVEPVVSGTMTANGRTTTVIYTGVYG